MEFGKSQTAVENGKMEKTGCKIICGAPTTLTVKGLMMMMSKKSKAKLTAGVLKKYQNTQKVKKKT